MIDARRLMVQAIWVTCRSMTFYSYFVCIILTFSLFVHGISAIYIPKHIITNVDPKSHGGIKFEKVIGGIPYTKELMGKVNKFVVSTIFQQNSPADQRTHENETIYVYIKDFKVVGGIAVEGNQINISSAYLDGYQGDLKWEFTSSMYHEMTHLLAWNGESTMQYPLREGLAAYTILKANYFPPTFAKPGSGDKWDHGHDITARFYEYCDSITPAFVAKLNKMSRKTYNVKYFKDITGKPVEQLWKEYKTKYGQKHIDT